jgi:cyclophilin family peptidyl-prolyl cis-trans isomerase/HEAT repeat protein
VKKLLLLILLAVPAQAAVSETSRIQKMSAILNAEERREAGGAIADGLRDADPGVRRRAALAAGRVGDRALVPALGDRLGDTVVEVRQMAAFALGLVGDAAAGDRLVAALKDGDAAVRARAAQALGRLGEPRHAAAVTQMVLQAVPKGATTLSIRGDDAGSPTDPWLELRLGLFAIADLKDGASAQAVLLDAGKPRFDWWAATWTAATVGTPEMLPVLLASATASDPVARGFAAAGLARSDDPAARAALAALVRDRDEGVSVRALVALRESKDPAAAGLALTVLKEPAAARKAAALEVLATRPGAARTREEIVGLVGHEDPAVRAGALHVLAGMNHEELALILSGLDPDPVWSVRSAVAEGLAGSRDELGLGILRGMVRDGDARVAAAAVDALRLSEGPGADAVLVQSLTHADVAVREAAARGLAALAAQARAAGGAVNGRARELGEAYQASRRDVDPEARLAIVAALGAQAGDAGAAETLRAAASGDPLLSVRRAAARALGNGAVPGAGAAGRPRLDDHLAMAPYDARPDLAIYTPRAFLHTRRGVVEIHLNTLEAPVAARAFVALARRGFFDGLALQRVVPGVRAEGGCPRGDGRGGPGFRFGREAGLRPFGRGAVGLDAAALDTEGSRFFITLAPDPAHDGRATLLGTVVKGMEIVERLRPHDTIDSVEIWDGR